MVTTEAITQIRQDRVSFKTLDAVDEFTDFIKSKTMRLDDKKFDDKYKAKYEFDIRKDSLNYYATVRSKTDKEKVAISNQYKQIKSPGTQEIA